MLLLLQEAHGGCERLQQRVDELSSTARHTALELKSREEALSSTSHEREGLQRQLAALLATHKEVQAEAQVSGNKVRVGIRQRRRCRATRCGWASGRPSWFHAYPGQVRAVARSACAGQNSGRISVPAV